MSTLAIVLQIIIAVGVLNVWLLRQDQPSRWRPEGASNMTEEFRRYGFSDGFRKLVGAVKVTLALLLIAGIWFPALAVVGAIGMAIMMAGAIGAHIKISDPLYKSTPSLTLLLLSVSIAFIYLA